MSISFCNQVLQALTAAHQRFTQISSDSSLTEKTKQEIDYLINLLYQATEDKLRDICDQGPTFISRFSKDGTLPLGNNYKYLAILSSLLTFISSQLSAWEDIEGITYEMSSHRFVWTSSTHLQKPYACEFTGGSVLYIPQPGEDGSVDLEVFMREASANLVLRAKIYCDLISGPPSEEISSSAYLVSPISINVTTPGFVTALRVQFIAQNNCLHNKVTSQYSPQLNKLKDWLNTDIEGMEQFQNLICLLSESNELTSPLDKFVKKYQILEDILFRRSLIDVMSSIHPHPFSLRAWKQVAEKTEDSELAVLQSCFKYLFNQTKNPANDVRDSISTYWNNFQASYDTPTTSQIKLDIERIISLVISNKNFKFTQNLFAGNVNEAANLFAKGLYSFRNSIVHHKATEFALSSETATLGVIKFIDDFWLPALDYICYFCISNENAKFRYPQKSVELW